MARAISAVMPDSLCPRSLSMENIMRAMMILAFAATLFVPSTASAAADARKILLVVSSHGRDHGKTQPGFEMDELAQAWLIFRDNDIVADIASPEGGGAVADEFDARKPYNHAFATDGVAATKIARTLRLSEIDPKQYAAIFIIGGKGAMFDLPFSQALTGLIATIHGGGGVVGAVCHGPAVFARMRNSGGQPFASGRTLAGFTDEEEALFGKKWAAQFPFQIESELRRQGADFSEGPFMLPHVAIDDRIVTGQNPFSVTLAAEAVVAALGRVPAPRPQWPDEKSMMLLAASLTQTSGTLADALAKDHKNLDIPLIAIWGYYRTVEAAGERSRSVEGLRVMEAAEPWFVDKGLHDAIASVRKKLAVGEDGEKPR